MRASLICGVLGWILSVAVFSNVFAQLGVALACAIAAVRL